MEGVLTSACMRILPNSSLSLVSGPERISLAKSGLFHFRATSNFSDKGGGLLAIIKTFQQTINIAG